MRCAAEPLRRRPAARRACAWPRATARRPPGRGGRRRDPAAPARPGRVVDAQRRAERRARLGLHELPGGDQVDRRVADGERAEVDHGGEAAVADEQVAGRRVAVDPDRRAVPRPRGQRRLPRGGDRGGVEDAVERGDHGRDARRHDRRVAQVVERAAAEAVAPLRRRAAVRVDPLQGGEERGEVERGPPRVAERGGRRRLAVEPAQHRPGIRVALGRRAPRQRLGDRQREPRREPRQPRLLALDLPDPALVAREPHRHRIAEPVGVVVPPGLGDRGHREAGPFRELAGHQPPDEVRVDPGRVRHAADRTPAASRARRPALVQHVQAWPGTVEASNHPPAQRRSRLTGQRR